MVSGIINPHQKGIKMEFVFTDKDGNREPVSANDLPDFFIHIAKDKPMDFHYSSAPEISDATKGKTIERVEINNDMEDWLIFYFTDKTELRLRYDWIYEWFVTQPKESE